MMVISGLTPFPQKATHSQIALGLLALLVSVIITGQSTLLPPLVEAGLVPSSLLLRLLVRMRVSVVCMRVLAPRMRMRTLGSACAVFDGLQNSGHGATKIVH